MVDERNGLGHLYEDVRAIVEERCGAGSLTREKFTELCRLGKAEFARIQEKRQVWDPLRQKLRDLQQRIERLEARSGRTDG